MEKCFTAVLFGSNGNSYTVLRCQVCVYIYMYCSHYRDVGRAKERRRILASSERREPLWSRVPYVQQPVLTLDTFKNTILITVCETHVVCISCRRRRNLGLGGARDKCPSSIFIPKKSFFGGGCLLSSRGANKKIVARVGEVLYVY